MNGPKVDYRNTHVQFWLSTYLGISYSTAKHHTFNLPPQKISGRCTSLPLPQGAENPSYATAKAELWSSLKTILVHFCSSKTTFGKQNFIKCCVTKLLKRH